MRQMQSDTERLLYHLYSNVGRTTEWGNTVDTGLAITGSGSSQTIPVYGMIPKNQTVTALKNFKDTISVTLTY